MPVNSQTFACPREEHTASVHAILASILAFIVLSSLYG
jgi:hypothetical protein